MACLSIFIFLLGPKSSKADSTYLFYVMPGVSTLNGFIDEGWMSSYIAPSTHNWAWGDNKLVLIMK